MLATFLEEANSHLDCRSYVQGCRSVRPATTSADLVYGYRSPAYVPGNVWEELTASTAGTEDIDAGVALFHIANLDSCLANASIILTDRLERPLAGADQIAIARCVLPRLTGLLELGRELKPLGLFRHEGRLLTTTREPSGHRTGLHVDSWYGESLAGRSDRPGRLVLNLGPGTRYFYAVAPLVSQRPFHSDVSPTEIVLDILENDANMRLVRLTLPPGFGYIANTEDVIHDGSTIDSCLASYTFTVMGKFKPSAYRRRMTFEYS